jgi:septal ring factor EnvC (AmiA/AmiB activator)
MLSEIEKRDEGHQTLEEKLGYVDNEINNLAKQLEHSNRVNSRLKDDLKKARARDKIVMDLEKRLDA